MKRIANVALMLAAGSALANGFQIDTQSARATGMGGAAVGLVDDSTANFYNPAGLAQGTGVDIKIGDTLIFPQLKFTDPAGTTTSNQFQVAPPFNVYASAGLETVTLGVGVFSAFGAQVNWPETWEGQFKARQSSLQTFDINPNLAWRVHPRLSIAAGFNAVRGTVLIERHLNFIDSQGAVTLGGGAWGIGYNLGAQVEIIEKVLFFGASFRSNTTMNFKGSAHFEGVPAEFSGSLHDQSITSKLTLPLIASFGFGVYATDALRFGLDFNYVGWGSFPQLDIEFQDPSLTVPIKKKWIDTVSVHLGGEYDVSRSVSARLGVAYDPSASPQETLSPDLPDATRVEICAGVGYHHPSGFNADLGFQFIVLVSAPSTVPGFPGTYSGTAEVVGLNVGWKF